MNVAFIPVRGGSKSIPLKNIKPICGKPLVFWTVRAACGCDAIDEVFVSTDSHEIRDVVEGFGLPKVRVIGRSAESASDTASTEFAMLEFARNYEFDNIVLIQATSPLLESRDLDQGFCVFSKEGVDSVLSVVPQKRFTWAMDETGLATPTNYDVYARPRRQDFEAYYVENGAFYITSRTDLIQSENRVSGNIHAVPMDEDTFLEIDEPSDWPIIEQLLQRRLATSAMAYGPIKLFLTDCDGCLTDGGMYYSENGDELKRFDTRDGMGFKLLREAGIKCGIVTSEDRELNRRRAKKLQLDYLVQGCTDKLSVVKRMCNELGISLCNVAYMGDDINDVPPLEAIRAAGGISAAPKDAMHVATETAAFVTTSCGGHGAVREIVSQILEWV